MNEKVQDELKLPKRSAFALVPGEQEPTDDARWEEFKKALLVMPICGIGVATVACFVFAVLSLFPSIGHAIGALFLSSSSWSSLPFTALSLMMTAIVIVYRKICLPPPTHLIVSPKRIVSVQSLKANKYHQEQLERLTYDDLYKGSWRSNEEFGVLASVNWEDIVRISSSIDKNGSQMLYFHTRKGKRVKMRLGDLLGNDSRKALLDGLKRWAPNAICDPDAYALLEPRPETSYTELWISALSAPPEQNRIAPLDSGTRLGGKYEITSRLGAGGQATVYLARDIEKTSDTEVVLKEYVLPIGVTRKATKEAIETLEDEAKLLERLNHPQIVKLLDFFVEDHRGYMVFEHVPGTNLRTLVKRDGVFSEQKIREITVQVCNILKYLHSQEPPVLHKDLSPDNLILAENGQLKLIDFSVAQRAQTTATAMAQGKRSYMPPEQFRGRPTVQSDIYALGCSMYFLAIGEDPEPLSVCHPKLMRAELSDGLDFVIAGCTQLDASARYKSAHSVQSDLEQL
jgi:tRNA A-37 threonylcarbamoyl transferase component Bud32